MVEHLPEPARRFFLHAIAPGTPLARSVEVEMVGTLAIAPGRPPLRMRATQVLAPPEGFIWRAHARGGGMRIRGFDRYTSGSGEMRWRLFGVIPVMRAEGEDVTRSAAGRLALEAVFLPSSLLPERGVEWEPVDDDRARFRMAIGDETVAVTLRVDPAGVPVHVSAMRWDGTEPDAGRYRRFDAEMSGSFSTGGYTTPRRIEAGWALGEPDEHRFFEASLTSMVFR